MDTDVEALEVELLLEGILRRYRYDFRGYAPGSLKRRLWRRARAERLPTLSALQERVLHDPACMERLLADLSISVTEMFRDPGLYRALRAEVVPVLRTFPFLRVWDAGCSTGEEAYSLAVLLVEEGLYDRSRIYATDVNTGLLERAARGVFPLDRMQAYTENYLRAGGTRPFSEYYTTEGGGARFDPALAENVIFAQHNLVSDHTFNEFHLIVCRNVLIYFAKPLQDRVHDLFYASLATSGVLVLGARESLRCTVHEQRYDTVDAVQRVYRRVA